MVNDVEFSVGVTGIGDIQLLKRELLDIPKKAKASASVFEREFNKAEVALRKTAKANQEVFNSVLGLDKSVKSAEASFSVFEKQLIKNEIASKKEAKALEDVRRSIDPLRNATLAYEQKLEILENAFRQNKLSVEEYRKSLELLRLQAQMSGLAFDKQGNILQKSSKNMKMFQMQVQQAGYQVGDFFTQVAMGQNPLMAFSTQATQLAGFFGGPWGAAIGAGISILGALGVAFMASQSGASSLEEALEALSETITDLQTDAELIRFGVADKDLLVVLKEIERLTDEINTLSVEGNTWEMTRLEGKREELRLKEVEYNLAKSISEVTKGYDEEAIADAQRELSILQTTNDLIKSGVNDREAEAKATAMVAEALIKSQLAAKGLTEAQREALEVALSNVDTIYAIEGALSDAEAEADLLAEGLTQSAIEALRLAGVDIAGPISDAALEAANLAGHLGIALSEAISIQNMRASLAEGYSGRGGDPRQFMKGGSSSYTNNFKPFEYTKPKSGGGGSSKEQEDYLQSLLDEANQKLKLIGLTEEQSRRQEIIFELEKKKLPIDEARIEQVLKAEEALRKATEAEQRRTDMIDSVTSNIESGFMSMIDGSKSVSDAFKSMIREILLDIYKQQVAKPFASGIGKLLGGFLKGGSWSANGNIFKAGNVVPFANGGVVGSPTMFPMPAGRTGVMGEAGPEAIMPLKRGKDGKLGVQMSGAEPSVTIVQNFSFSANGDESVKKIIAEAAPKIAQMTQQQIIDSRRRGGKMKATFG